MSLKIHICYKIKIYNQESMYFMRKTERNFESAEIL